MTDPRVIAHRGASLLIQVDDENARILDTRHRRIFPPQNIESALARGYWEEFTGDPTEWLSLLPDAHEVENVGEIPNVWDGIEGLFDLYDASIEIECASSCAWSGELRLTLTNPPQAPSRSITFFSTGGTDPSDVASALLEDAEVWLEESGVAPLPVPDWMRIGEQ